MKQQHVSITIAARVGQSPIYPRIGQGLLGGTIVSVRQGDSESAHHQIEELEHVFGTEFDRGELTVDNLRPVLWAAHWLKAVRPVAQRASELLTLAAGRAFEPGSKAARDCDAVARVMASVATTEPHCLTALEAARKIRVPADFYAGERQCIGSEVASTALRADGIRAFLPSNCPDCAAISTSPHGCGRDGIHEAGKAYDAQPSQQVRPESTDDLPAMTVSIIEQRVRERAQRRYKREVSDAFFTFRKFCGDFEPLIDGKPHKASKLFDELERQCYEQGKEWAGDSAVEAAADTIASRLDDLLGGAA